MIKTNYRISNDCRWGRNAGLRRLVCGALALVSVFCIWEGIKLETYRRQAESLMAELATLQVGKTTEAEASRTLGSLSRLRNQAQDCFAGPCLEGAIYRIHRGSLAIVSLWPVTDLNVGIFFDHGVLVIKEAELKQDSRSAIRVVEYAYPLPDRHWERDSSISPSEMHRGNAIFIALDQRADQDEKARAFRLNLSCFTAIRGCPEAADLQAQ